MHLYLATDPESWVSTLFLPHFFFTFLLDPSWEPAEVDALWALRTPLPSVFQWQAPKVEVIEDAGSVSVTLKRTDGSEGNIDMNWASLSTSPPKQVSTKQ